MLHSRSCTLNCSALHCSNQVKVKVMLLPTVSRPGCLGTKYPSRAYQQVFITVRQLRVYWYGAPSLTRGRVCLLQCTIYLHFTCYYLNVYTIYTRSLSVQAQYSRSKVKVKVKVTLRLAVYRQSVRLSVKPLETHDQIFFFNWTPAVIVLM
jgi:hypothetical protein